MSIAAIMADVEPLPLVPATWTIFMPGVRLAEPRQELPHAVELELPLVIRNERRPLEIDPAHEPIERSLAGRVMPRRSRLDRSFWKTGSQRGVHQVQPSGSSSESMPSSSIGRDSISFGSGWLGR